MVVTTEQKQALIAEYGDNAKDSGNTKVQVAILTAEINDLTVHLKANPKDYATLRGLKAKVSERNSLVTYFKKHHEADEHKKLIEKLGIRK